VKTSKCKTSTSKGTICQAPPFSDQGYCFFHDPDLAKDRAKAQSVGGAKGKAMSLPINEISQIAIKSSSEILKLIGETIHQVRTGQLDPRIANCVGYLSGIALKAIEQSETEERLAALEVAVQKNKGSAEKDFNSHGGQLFSFENQE
jgi:hypothetical protein